MEQFGAAGKIHGWEVLLRFKRVVLVLILDVPGTLDD